MHIVVVDDERLSLSLFLDVCAELAIDAKITCFQNPYSALDYMLDNRDVSASFLDIEMPGMTGMELATKMRELVPSLHIVFVTGHDEYARQAFRIHANGFVSKPFSPCEVEAEIRKIPAYALSQSKRIFFKTFGHFEMMVDDQPVQFSLNKAKELLAYLVDRKGSAISNEHAINILWEGCANDVKSQNRFRKVVHNLRVTLNDYEVEHIFNNRRNSKSLNTEFCLCDYYEYLKGNGSTSDFMGEYMTGYAWGEPTLAALTHRHHYYPTD